MYLFSVVGIIRAYAVAALLLVVGSVNVSSLEVHPTKRVNLKSGTRTIVPLTLKSSDLNLSSTFKIMTMRSAHSHARLPSSNTMRRIETSDTRVQQSSVPVDDPRRRKLPDIARDWIDSMSPKRKEKGKRPSRRAPPITKDAATTIETPEKKLAITKMDVCLFATYFCNIIAVTLSVVTVPALAAEHFSSPHAMAAFCAGVASMAPLGGGFGKIINGFVCQRLGGQRSSWLYLVGLAVLSVAMSLTTSAAPIGLILMGFEFLSSIQWTSICHVMMQQYQQQPELMARGIAIISLASTTGALAAKTFGACLLQATNWRVVTQCGAGVALLGALTMKVGVSDPQVQHALEPTKIIGGAENQNAKEEKGGGLVALKVILSNPLFWQIGIAHSLGYLARGNDRLLGSFLQEISNLPRHICAGLTSSVTVGFLFGLAKGKVFSGLESVQEKLSMLKKNYKLSFVSTLGLAVCGMAKVGVLVANPIVMAGAVTLLSGLMASTVAFQFYQLPNLVSTTVFSEHSAVSLSLIDGLAFFATAQVLMANRAILGNFGWSASWTFLAMIFGLGGSIMMKAMPSVLAKNQEQQSQRQLNKQA